MAALTGKQKRHLRGLAHHLEAVVVVGKEGVSDAVVEAIRAALLQHELIKVRVLESAPLGRDEAGGAIEERVGAAIAGAVGRILVVYQRHPEEPRIVLP
jgi:RNA-binding protein